MFNPQPPADDPAATGDPTSDQLRKALAELACEQPKAARIAELFLEGKSFNQIAVVIGETESQVLRQFQFARAWVRLHLGSRRAPPT